MHVLKRCLEVLVYAAARVKKAHPAIRVKVRHGDITSVRDVEDLAVRVARVKHFTRQDGLPWIAFKQIKRPVLRTCLGGSSISVGSGDFLSFVMGVCVFVFPWINRRKGVVMNCTRTRTFHPQSALHQQKRLPVGAPESLSLSTS